MASDRWDVFTLDNLWHYLLGGAIAGVCVAPAHFTSPWVVLASIPLSALVGFLREWSQHRGKTPQWTRHRVMEALAWVAGATTASAVYLLTALLR